MKQMVSKFRCYECDHVFTTPKLVEECVGEAWGVPYFETFACCPNCDSSDFDQESVEEEV